MSTIDERIAAARAVGAKCIAVEIDAYVAMKAERDALREALKPSGDTKYAYIGEFRFNVADVDENGDETRRLVSVPWTTIKEIMRAISARAALQKEGE